MAVRVLGVLAGQDTPVAVVCEWALSATVLYAADSAADPLAEAGLAPIVVGDLDSVAPAALQQASRVVQDPDHARTDCDKLLALAEADGHRSITIIGFEGDLVDHMLAATHSFARSGLDIRIVTRRAIAYVVRPGMPRSAVVASGKRVSLIPVTRCTGVALDGVVWPVANEVMEPTGHLSISNEATGPVSASVESGVALLFIEHEPDQAPFW